MIRISGYPSHIQEQINWCWAAITCGVGEHFGSSSNKQCLLANAELCQTDCCSNGATPVCNKNWYLDRVLSSVHHLDYNSSGRISINQIQSEINSDEPIGIHIHWLGSNDGHFCAIVGGGVGKGGTDYVEIEDPHYGRSIVPDTDLNGSYRKCGNWDWTYRTKQ